MSITLSIVIPVLNSHEVVRRQLAHFRLLDMDGVELILVDDGSKPPLPDSEDAWCKVIRTGDTRPWTHPKARNAGAREAQGKYLLVTDIDHIVGQDAIDAARDGKYGLYRFRRELGTLDGNGFLHQDIDELVGYGVPRERFQKSGFWASPHAMSMIVKRSVFEETGGFRERLGEHPTHDDGHMKRMLRKMQNARRFVKCPDDERPKIHMIPSGRFCGDKNANPFGLFHETKR